MGVVGYCDTFARVEVICFPLFKAKKILEIYDKIKLLAEANLMEDFVSVLLFFHSLAR